MLTQADVKHLFDYHPDGKLIWKNPTNRAVKPGTVAGVKKPAAYSVVSISAKIYMVHRLVYLWHTGEWPQIVDHIDNDKTNNRIENLRAATPEQNMANRRGWAGRKKGVVPAGSRWGAVIRAAGKQYWLGTFDSEDEAHAAYVEAANRLHGVFAKTS